MNKYIYIAAFALCGSSLAQDQNRNPNQSPSGQSQNQPGATQIQPATTTQSTPTTTATGNRATQTLKNMFGQWRLEDLPAPVQKTVREQSGGQQIADIDRHDRHGQAVWEVEFEREGRNPKIHISNDGKLLTEQESAQLHKDYGLTTPGVGNPGATETGRAKTGFGTQWEDLPQSIQQRAMQFGGKEKAKDIDLKHRNGKNVYALEFERPGRNLEVTFAENGTILKSNDPSTAPAQGAAPGSEVGRNPSLQQPIQPQPQPLPPAQPVPQSQQPNQNPKN